MKNTLLRAARHRKGWSQQQLADFAAISVATVVRAENGRTPRIDNIQRLCECLEKTPEQLGFVKQEGSEQRKSARMSMFSGKGAGEAQEESASPPVLFTPEQVASLLQLLASGDITMAHFDQQRREALLRLLSTASTLSVAPQALADPEPWERLRASLDQPANLDAATLKHFEALTEICWQCSNSGQLQTAEQVLACFLPRFLQLALAHPQAASLASDGLRLQSILVAHRLQLADKVRLCQRSVMYAKHAGDSPALVVALFELAFAFRYLRQDAHVLNASQEMLSYIQQVPPSLQARAYIAAAEAFSRTGRIREADFYIQLAYETFPEHSAYDLITHTNANIFSLGLYEGLAYLKQGKGDKAFNTFSGQLFEGRVTGYQSTSALPERIRLEVTNHQGHAAILSNNLEEYARCLEEGIMGAVAIKSHKRFQEAVTIFQQEVPAKWRDEPLLKELAERFQLVG